MNEINHTDFNLFKAKAISRGKLLERFRCHIEEIVKNADNEGDRVYFGSTNDFDYLKDIAGEMEMWAWDRIIKERPEIDPYAALRELRENARALLAAVKDLSALYDGIYVKISDDEMALCREAWGKVDAAVAKVGA